MNTGRDVVSLLRDLSYKTNARRQYLHEHERLERMSRDLFTKGETYTAEGAHYWAMVALQAAEAERNDPECRS